MDTENFDAWLKNGKAGIEHAKEYILKSIDFSIEKSGDVIIESVISAYEEYRKLLNLNRLKAARERRRAETGKCEGRKSYSEANPEIIREIRRLRRKSKNRKPVTFSEIAVCLNEKGHRTLTGGFFTTANVQMLLNRSVQVKRLAIDLQRKPDSVTSSNQV